MEKADLAQKPQRTPEKIGGIEEPENSRLAQLRKQIRFFTLQIANAPNRAARQYYFGQRKIASRAIDEICTQNLADFLDAQK